MYFFAIQTDRGIEIDSIGDQLDDSHRFEEVDVAAGLIAWDDRGTTYRFEPQRESERDGWAIGTTERGHSDALAEALRRFLLQVTQNRHHRRRAALVGASSDFLRTASLDELIAVAAEMDLAKEY